MLAGGVTESITHFAGYLHLIIEEPRLRELFEDPAHRPRTDPWKPPPSFAPAPDQPLDELPSQPFRAPYLSDPDLAPHATRMPHPDSSPQTLPSAHGPQALGNPHQLYPVGIGGGGGGGHSVQTITYDVEPDQELLQIFQLNSLHDGDSVLMLPGTHPESLHLLDPASTIDSLVRVAAETVPDDLVLQGRGTQDALAFADSRAAAMQASPHAGGVGYGTFVDGVRQPDGTKLDFTVPQAQGLDNSSHDGLTNPGLDAQTGSNVSANLATIFDEHTQHVSLIVQGNAYSTDAIIQTNVLVSKSVIDAAGDAVMRSISTNGNTAQNGASISQHETGSNIVQHLAFGSNVAVDRIDGDFYDVRTLTQANLLSDNDVVVQASFGAYYVASTGNNTQLNELPASALNDRYDLIVVQGDHHTANLIYQTNVLLNDSLVQSYTARSDTGSQSISTGGNTLTNTAAIDHYGTSDYQSFSSSLSTSIDHLAQGQLDPDLAKLLPSQSDGTVHVLFITGNFYDINAIAQTNIVSNIDTVIQYSADPGTSVTPSGQTTTSTQAVSTGDNHLSNIADIASVGTLSQAKYLGGTHYDDAILLQANIVSDSSRITIGDTHTLANEVVAFTGLPAPMIADDHVPAPVVATDTSFHHDLFHGMLA